MPSSRRESRRSWQQPRQVEQYWTFYKKGFYVSKRPSGLPAWLIPLVVFLIIVSLVFWIVPQALSRLRNNHEDDPGIVFEHQSDPYGTDVQVVQSPVADVFFEPDLKADRVTQALYNEPVTILPEQCLAGFAAVQLNDGTTGYMMTKDLTQEQSSIEQANHAYRLLVITPTKRIMSHARQGTLLAEVMMGTELLVSYRGAGVARVQLPGGSEGWMSDDGVLILSVDETVELPFEPRQAFCSTALLFLQATYLENGQSIHGISIEGIARLAGAANGITIPRTLDGIASYGNSIPFRIEEETRTPDLSVLQPGDLVIFAKSQETQQPYELAIHIDSGQVLYTGPGQSSIRLINLDKHEDLWRRILDIRRLFAE